MGEMPHPAPPRMREAACKKPFPVQEDDDRRYERADFQRQRQHVGSTDVAKQESGDSEQQEHAGSAVEREVGNRFIAVPKRI